MNTPQPCEQLFTPRFQVTAEAGQIRVRPEVPAAAPAAVRSLGLVKVYGRAPGPYTLAWLERGTEGPRKRTMRANWAGVKKAAGKINTALTNSQVARSQLDEAAASEYLRCHTLAAALGRSVESIVRESIELTHSLGGASLQTAAGFYLEHRPAAVTAKNVPQIVDQLLETKRKEKKGGRWLDTLDHQLGAFAGHFTGPLHAVQPHELNAWLEGLDVGLRTRANYRAAVGELVRFAQARNYLDKNWDHLDRVPDAAVPPVEARIYSPAQLARLAACCHENLLPMFALMAWAGIRHEEISQDEKRVQGRLLDWSNINLQKAQIRIRLITAKTKELRLIRMQPNLVAWLTPYARRSGPICELKCTGDALYRLGRRAGIKWIKNALRKSFISYRLAQTNDIGLVAEESGNSAKMIKANYRELAEPDQAKDYFNIFPPTQQQILQLNFGFK